MILDALRSLRNPAPARRSDAISYLSSLSEPADWVFEWLGARRQSSSGMHVSKRTALEQASFWAGVEVISGVAAMMPLVLYRRLKRGRERAVDDPRYDLMAIEPNPEMSSYNWRQKVFFDLLTSNNHYSRLEVDGRNRVLEIWPLDPQRVTKGRKNGQLEFVHRPKDGTEERIPPGEMLHFYGLSDDGMCGINRIHQAVESIGLSLAAQTSAGSFFGRGMELSGHFESPQIFDEIARERLRKDMDARHVGPGKRHGIDIFDEGLTWKQKSANLREAQYVDARKFQTTENARWLGLPPTFIQDHERATFSNVEHNAIHFVTYTMLRNLKLFEQEVDRKVIARDERRSLYYEFLVDSLLRADSAARGEYLQRMFMIGAMSQNDIRELNNQNPVEGGDRYYVPLNMVPVDRVDDAIDDPEDDPDPDAGDEDGEASARDQAARLRRAFDDVPDVTKPEQRSLKLRRRIRSSHRPLFLDAGKRVIRSEVEAVRKAVRRHLGARDAQSLIDALRKIYAELPAAMLRRILPALRALAEQIQGAIADEFDTEANLTAELEEFVRKVGGASTQRHAGVQLGQLEKLIREFGANDEDLEARLLDRLDEWAERWPDKFARRETVQAGEAFARFAFVAAGVTQLRWAASGETCPFCEAMDGVVVGREAPFVSKGQTLQGDEEHADLTAEGNVFHPPLHDGCDCSVVPG